MREQNMSARLVLLLAVALWVAALLHGGIYVGVTAGTADRPAQVYRVNRFTGEMTMCRGSCASRLR